MATAQMPKTMFVIVSEEEEEEEEVEEKDVGAKGTMPVEGEVEELTGDMLIEGYDCGISVVARLSDLEYTEAAQWMCLTHGGNRALLMRLDSPFTEQLERGWGSQHGKSPGLACFSNEDAPKTEDASGFYFLYVRTIALCTGRDRAKPPE